MKINKYLLLVLLSLWIAILYDVSVVDFSTEYPVFRLKKELTLTGPHVETSFELNPGGYLLKIIHNSQQLSNNVWINGEIINSFKVHKAQDTSEYFYLRPDQIQKSNMIRIDMCPDFSGQLTVKFQNYRHMPIKNCVLGLPRSIAARLVKFKPIQFAVVFLLAFSFLIAEVSFLKESGQKHLNQLVIILGLVLTVTVIIHALPFVKVIFFISPACFFVWWIIPLIICFLIFIRGAIDRARQSALIAKAGKVVHSSFITKENDIFVRGAKNTNTRGFVIFVVFFLFLILSVLRFYIVMDRRVPVGHDTFQYLQLQYALFFNEPALNKAIPQWFPFMTHGTVSNLWLTFSQGIFVSVIAPVATFLKDINFYSIFQAGLLFDELILLFGCVALARRYFKSFATTLFVTSSIVFTTISSTQIWWDFRLLYLFPITLYCFDRALRENSAKYLFLACLFVVGMMLGNPPYCAPLFVFFLCVFGLSVWLYFPQQTLTCLKQFFSRFKLRHVIAILVPCALLLIIFLFMKYGTGEIVTHNSKRSGNWQVTGLKDFLEYGGNINLQKNLGMIFRGSNNLDNTVYAGLLIVPFIFLTFLRVRSRLSYACGLTALVMVLFTAGLVVPVIFYYAFPLAKYYRHIGLIGPLAKLFIVFYSGFGFERFWQSLKIWSREEKNKYLLYECKASFLTLIVLFAGIIGLIVFQWLSGYKIYSFPGSLGSLITDNQLYVSVNQLSLLMLILLILGGIFLVLLASILWFPKKAILIGGILLSVHLVDVVSFKAKNEIGRLPEVDREVVNLFNTCRYSFSRQRSQDYFSNNRFCRLAPYLFLDEEEPFDPNQPSGMIAKYGVQYWNLDMFLFFDPVSHVYSTQRWLKGVEAFYGAWVPASDRCPTHAGFPLPQSPAFKKLCGSSCEKLQLFSNIHVLKNDKDVSEMLSNPEYEGDMLLTSNIDSELSKTNNDALLIDADDHICSPEKNERIREGDILIKNFTFNKLQLQVSNTMTSDAVLYYADAWHPEWHAYVNNRPVSVFKTNLAYKSVIVPPGTSEVVFEYGGAISEFLFNSMVAIGIIVFCGFCYCLFIGLIEKGNM